jgi:uncharacterized protein YbjT (DUF2867 family)
VKSGVRRIVLLSGRGEEGAVLGEEAVRAAGANWTILLCSWFAQKPQRGSLRGAGAERRGRTTVGQLYELTGPRLMTFAEAVAEIGKAMGRDIRYQQVSMGQYKALLAENHVPADFVWLIDHLFTTVLDGRNSHVTDGVQRALGRKPRDFGEYARATATAGGWGPAHAPDGEAAQAAAGRS